MVAPVYTWKPVPPEAPSCATCKHFKLHKGFPIFGTDRTFCLHPKAVHKITGAAADAYMVRMSSAQQECNVDGLWWEAEEAKVAVPQVIRSGRIEPPKPVEWKSETTTTAPAEKTQHPPKEPPASRSDRVAVSTPPVKP